MALEYRNRGRDILIGLGCHNKISQGGRLKKEKVFLVVLGVVSPRSRLSAGWVSLEASLRGVQMAAFLLCPYTAFSLCAYIPAVPFFL